MVWVNVSEEGIKFLAQGKLLDGEAGEDFFKFQGRFRRGGVGHNNESTRMLGAEIKLASRASTSRSLRKKKRIAQGSIIHICLIDYYMDIYKSF